MGKFFKRFSTKRQESLYVKRWGEMTSECWREKARILCPAELLLKRTGWKYILRPTKSEKAGHTSHGILFEIRLVEFSAERESNQHLGPIHGKSQVSKNPSDLRHSRNRQAFPRPSYRWQPRLDSRLFQNPWGQPRCLLSLEVGGMMETVFTSTC